MTQSPALSHLYPKSPILIIIFPIIVAPSPYRDPFTNKKNGRTNERSLIDMDIINKINTWARCIITVKIIKYADKAWKKIELFTSGIDNSYERIRKLMRRRHKMVLKRRLKSTEQRMTRSERVGAESATKSARIETRVNYPNDEN